MKQFRTILLSLIFALSAASFAFADVAVADPIERATGGALNSVSAIIAVAIAGVLAFVSSKRNK